MASSKQPPFNSMDSSKNNDNNKNNNLPPPPAAAKEECDKEKALEIDYAAEPEACSQSPRELAADVKQKHASSSSSTATKDMAVSSSTPSNKDNDDDKKPAAREASSDSSTLPEEISSAKPAELERHDGPSRPPSRPGAYHIEQSFGSQAATPAVRCTEEENLALEHQEEEEDFCYGMGDEAGAYNQDQEVSSNPDRSLEMEEGMLIEATLVEETSSDSTKATATSNPVVAHAEPTWSPQKRKRILISVGLFVFVLVAGLTGGLLKKLLHEKNEQEAIEDNDDSVDTQPVRNNNTLATTAPEEPSLQDSAQNVAGSYAAVVFGGITTCQTAPAAKVLVECSQPLSVLSVKDATCHRLADNQISCQTFFEHGQKQQGGIWVRCGGSNSTAASITATTVASKAQDCNNLVGFDAQGADLTGGWASTYASIHSYCNDQIQATAANDFECREGEQLDDHDVCFGGRFCRESSSCAVNVPSSQSQLVLTCPTVVQNMTVLNDQLDVLWEEHWQIIQDHYEEAALNQ